MASKIVNPLTGHKIQVGGKTYNKLMHTIAYIDELLESEDQYGGGAGADKMDDFYESLLSKTKTLDTPAPSASGSRKDNGEAVNIPKSKYHLISSAMPPNPEQHSWYHHHAPFSQNFGDYVCLKKSTLRELGMFLKDSLQSDIL